MKKRMFITALILSCFIPLAAIDAEVIAVKGKAEVKTMGSWVLAKKGDIIKAGSTVSTAFKSELTLKIDGSTIVVQPLTRLTIEEIASKTETVSSQVYLNIGSVKADVKPASTKKVEFKVKTPVATASVRGTSGKISSDGTLEGYTGEWLYVANNGETVAINPGSVVCITDTGAINPPQQVMIGKAQATVVTSLAEKEKNAMSIASQAAIPAETENMGDDNNNSPSDPTPSPSPTPSPQPEPPAPKPTVQINISWED